MYPYMVAYTRADNSRGEQLYLADSSQDAVDQFRAHYESYGYTAYRVTFICEDWT